MKRASGGAARRLVGKASIVVFIDRDGVLNQDPDEIHYVRKPEQFKWIPGVLAELKRLTRAGASIVVISNQAGVGKGLMSPAELNVITAKIFADSHKAGARLSGIFYCTHAPEAGCGCRKPAAGLFEAADRSLNLSGKARYMIGDTERDLAAGGKAGCRTVLVLSGKTRTAKDVQAFKTQPDRTVRNLKEATTWILTQKNS